LLITIITVYFNSADAITEMNGLGWKAQRGLDEMMRDV
jgi:hypothetical protein